MEEIKEEEIMINKCQNFNSSETIVEYDLPLTNGRNRVVARGRWAIMPPGKALSANTAS